MTQKFSESPWARADQLAEHEKLSEEFLHVIMGLQGLFDHLESITNGVSISFCQPQLSPLLVYCNTMMKEVRASEVEQKEFNSVLMIAPGNVWKFLVPYVMTWALRIHIMIYF